MKVLENNHGLNKTCPYCFSKLFVNFTDLRALEDFHNPIIRCNCGACGETIYIDEDEVPYSKRMALFEKYNID